MYSSQVLHPVNSKKANISEGITGVTTAGLACLVIGKRETVKTERIWGWSHAGAGNLLLPPWDSSFPQHPTSQGYGKERANLPTPFTSFHPFPPKKTHFNSCTLEKPNSAGRWRRQNLWKQPEGMRLLPRKEKRNENSHWSDVYDHTAVICCKHVWFFCTGHLGDIFSQFLSNQLISSVLFVNFCCTLQQSGPPDYIDCHCVPVLQLRPVGWMNLILEWIFDSVANG